MTNEMRLPVLCVKGGAVLTNSRNVADFFGKRHDNVLAAIDRLECSPGFALLNFKESSYISDLGDGLQRSYKSIDMTKDGFTFLCMGFTGKEAAAFKEAYIQRFNEMQEEIYRLEAEVADSQEIVPYTPESEARLLVGQAQRTFGPKAAQQLWGHLGLPVVPAMLLAEPQAQMTFTFSASMAANQNLPRAA